MNNKDVIKEFAYHNIAKGKNLFAERRYNNILVLYSFGYHFPMCIELKDNTYVVNTDGYSISTKKQRYYLLEEFGYSGYKDFKENHSPKTFILKNTVDMLNIINNNITTMNEIIEEQI